MKSLFLLLVIVTLSAPIGQGLKCYNCLHFNCLSRENELGDLIECNRHFSRPRCIKVKIEGYPGAMRSCVDDSLHIYADSCWRGRYNFTKRADECHCAEDGCNSASTTTKISLVFALTMIILYSQVNTL